MDPPRENSPTTPSRYLNSYLQQNSTEIFQQNFPQRPLQNQQFYTADNLTISNKNYLKRHHQNYHNDKNETDREKKFDKYDGNKKIDDGAIQQGTYDGFNNESYSGTNITTATTTGAGSSSTTPAPSQPKAGAKSLSNGKKTKGRVKIKMEYIDNKLRRYTTFSKRKTGIMKKAYELSTLTGTQVMLLVASETGHVYTFATRKLQPMITSEAGKTLIQTCLNSPDVPAAAPTSDQRMSATGFEETELNYSISEIGDNPGDKEKDDITSTDDSCCESNCESNDENFAVPNQPNHLKLQLQTSNPVTIYQKNGNEDNAQQLLIQTKNQKINEKMLDNQKLLLESLSNLPQNLLQSWIQSGQLQVSIDDGRWNAIYYNPFCGTERELNTGNHNKENPDKASFRKDKTRSRIKFTITISSFMIQKLFVIIMK
ncbi:CLUMA_CG000065, isoform B [Clunio marinus]|uniref:Serum response factor homolog n=1 Tax=Clunio marinus TaxID=568069 RepID=A0A1J1HED7_9DIPT|nr:CLUMA_CG000065, isoform B [Clunio marinus]